jgi:hypothetical protein
MKKVSYYILSFAFLMSAFSSCNDDFLQKTPETAITAFDFFKTADDLRLYVNDFYNDGNLLNGGSFRDDNSDNVAYNYATNYSILLGNLSPQNAGGWSSWGSLRKVNFMLANLGNTGNIIPEDLNHYVGIARYFRALFYYNAIVVYHSDAPWINKPLETTDTEMLYKTQDSRALVVDSIMADLEFAVANIKTEIGNRTKVNRYAALAYLSRISLCEGTYRKYHPELNLQSTANRFLERAASAAEEIMKSGQFQLSSGATTEIQPGIVGSTPFRALFSSLDLTGNKEIIQWVDYNKGLNIRNSTQNLMSNTTHIDYSMSRALVESFLTDEGKPFSTVAGYATMEYKDIFAHRDPRLAETIAYPGVHMINPNRYIPVVPHSGGIDQVKFFPESNDKATSDNTGAWTGIPLYRYAEVLLNYAEAKAELGQFSDADAAKSINLLRDRVKMPHFDAARETDQDLRDMYPNVTDPTILAIRRERRVELAGEGLRQRDIYRWGVGELWVSTTALQGWYVPSLPYIYDATGQGTTNYGLVAKLADIAALPDDVKSKASNWYALDDLQIYLENGDHGHIRKIGDKDRRWVAPKYYYRPIPINQIVLNPNLKQPIGWE